MMANILSLLHPFIPFFTEFVWNKNKFNTFFKSYLVSSEWPEYKTQNNFNKKQNDINNIIELISGIRSTKAELNITPKLYCDIIFSEKSKQLKTLVNENINLIKQVGRVNTLLYQKDLNKNTVEILVLREKLALKFDEDIDMVSQKNKILHKIENIDKQKNKITAKLNNKAYLKNAPKEIVKNDKDLLKDLTIEDNKLRSIVSSIN